MQNNTRVCWAISSTATQIIRVSIMLKLFHLRVLLDGSATMISVFFNNWWYESCFTFGGLERRRRTAMAKRVLKKLCCAIKKTLNNSLANVSNSLNHVPTITLSKRTCTLESLFSCKILERTKIE